MRSATVLGPTLLSVSRCPRATYIVLSERLWLSRQKEVTRGNFAISDTSYLQSRIPGRSDARHARPLDTRTQADTALQLRSPSTSDIACNALDGNHRDTPNDSLPTVPAQGHLTVTSEDLVHRRQQYFWSGPMGMPDMGIGCMVICPK